MDIYMKEKCYICETELDVSGVFICRTHTVELYKILSNEITIKDAIIINPEFIQHCHICGEYENRVIINHPEWFYICNVCLESATKNYKMDINYEF